MTLRRFFAASVIGAVFLGLALPLSAATTTTATEGATTTVGGSATTAEAIIPAVSVEVTEAPETQPDWTYRFFIPTLLVLAGLVVIATVIQYFTRVVRKRYRIVR